MSKITKLVAREVLNSRGQWTVMAYVESDRGFFARSYLPLGRSRGPHESVIPDLREICRFISCDLARRICGKNVDEHFAIDAIIEEDCSQSPSLGNALLPVSVALLKLAAIEQHMPLWVYMRKNVFMNVTSQIRLPLPFVTLFQGGLHNYPFLSKSTHAENFQVVQLILEAQSVRQAIELARDVYRRLTFRLISEGPYKGISQDGGIAYFGRDEDMIGLALDETSLYMERLPNKHSFGFAIDVAASHLKANNRYQLVDRCLDSESMLQYICDLLARFPIWSIEDPFHNDDLHLWQRLVKLFPDLQVVGDDIFAGSCDLIRKGVTSGVANGFVLKPDFYRTVSGIADVVKTANENRISIVVSHRSGETCDTFVADLAAALDPVDRFGIAMRAGAPYCGERVSKWNRLLEIEQEAEFDLPLSFFRHASSKGMQ